MIKAKDIGSWQSALANKAALKTKEDNARAAKQGKPFASLTPVEKDELLYILAVRAGLIEPD